MSNKSKIKLSAAQRLAQAVGENKPYCGDVFSFQDVSWRALNRESIGNAPSAASKGVISAEPTQGPTLLYSKVPDSLAPFITSSNTGARGLMGPTGSIVPEIDGDRISFKDGSLLLHGPSDDDISRGIPETNVVLESPDTMLYPLPLDPPNFREGVFNQEEDIAQQADEQKMPIIGTGGIVDSFANWLVSPSTVVSSATNDLFSGLKRVVGSVVGEDNVETAIKSLAVIAGSAGGALLVKKFLAPLIGSKDADFVTSALAGDESSDVALSGDESEVSGVSSVESPLSDWTNMYKCGRAFQNRELQPSFDKLPTLGDPAQDLIYYRVPPIYFDASGVPSQGIWNYGAPLCGGKFWQKVKEKGKGLINKVATVASKVTNIPVLGNLIKATPVGAAIAAGSRLASNLTTPEASSIDSPASQIDIARTSSSPSSPTVVAVPTEINGTRAYQVDATLSTPSSISYPTVEGSRSGLVVADSGAGLKMVGVQPANVHSVKPISYSTLFKGAPSADHLFPLLCGDPSSGDQLAESLIEQGVITADPSRTTAYTPASEAGKGSAVAKAWSWVKSQGGKLLRKFTGTASTSAAKPILGKGTQSAKSFIETELGNQKSPLYQSMIKQLDAAARRDNIANWQTYAKSGLSVAALLGAGAYIISNYFSGTQQKAVMDFCRKYATYNPNASFTTSDSYPLAYDLETNDQLASMFYGWLASAVDHAAVMVEKGESIPNEDQEMIDTIYEILCDVNGTINKHEYGLGKSTAGVASSEFVNPSYPNTGTIGESGNSSDPSADLSAIMSDPTKMAIISKAMRESSDPTSLAQALNAAGIAASIIGLILTAVTLIKKKTAVQVSGKEDQDSKKRHVKLSLTGGD